MYKPCSRHTVVADMGVDVIAKSPELVDRDPIQGEIKAVAGTVTKNMLRGRRHVRPTDRHADVARKRIITNRSVSLRRAVRLTRSVQSTS